MSDVLAIQVQDLRKSYRTPFRRKRIDALRGVSFEVRRGEIYGFLGPNGAGKTTTIRALMGLVRATGGVAHILGNKIPSRAARAQVGFLPEHPYFYDYLTAPEFLDLVGRLCGVDRSVRRKRVAELIARVGLERATSQHLKKFSKGMLQRVGLAQALMNDPEVIVLDEPMSGLDPIGRKDVRDLILEQRERGKTVFFSSHILSDVEAIADRVAIVARGQIQAEGVPRELVSDAIEGVDVVLRLPVEADAQAKAVSALIGEAIQHRHVGDELRLGFGPEIDIDAVLALARPLGARVVSVTPQHETLEQLFLKRIASADAAGNERPGVGANEVNS